ncbi:MAG: hypothetical protein YFSK_4860 [Candidatus Yanofskyibacterium parasiticum]|nr:MAG: hypothetical protein YFSK_4860 [Candidatus Yanofskybacteria bacterium]
MSKFFKVLIVFALVLAAVGYGFWRKNIYSKEELKLEIFGPREAALGQEVEYVVKYKNNGDFRLENPSLVFTAPDFSIKDDKIFAKEVLDAEKLGGAIYPGEEKSYTFKFRVAGKAGEAKIAKASVSYQPKNLSARYESSTTFTTIMKEAPLDLEMDLSSTVEADKSFHLKINYFSNVDWLLTDLRVSVDYPAGYSFSQSSPKSFDKNEWVIPVLNKNQSGTIDIVGQLSGSLDEGKVFRARIGMWKDGQYMQLREIEKGARIVKPTVALRQTINGDANYTAKPGEWLHYEVYYKNVSDKELYNLVLVDSLEGDLFDLGTIKSETGSFRPGDNSLVFDWKQNSQLAYLPMANEGKVEFWIKLKDDLSRLNRPELANKVMVGPAREDFVTKISSRLELAQKAFYSDEIFGNTGPLPPQAGTATTYTVTWQAKNYYSNVKEVAVRATLPPEAQFVPGKIFPEIQTAGLTYNEATREIVWNIGDMAAGQGLVSNPLNVSFQIAVSPMSSQIGGTAGIIGQAVIKGGDEWTEASLESVSPALDTASLSDPILIENSGIVQPKPN